MPERDFMKSWQMGESNLTFVASVTIAGIGAIETQRWTY
jgi:hypothetical protein